MKAHRINFDDFNSVFKNREFDLTYKLTKRIYLIDNDEGSLSIEEHPSLIGYAIFLLVLIAAILPQLLIAGLKSIHPMWEEFKFIFIDRKPLRKDELNKNQKSTRKLLSVMRLEGLNNE